MCIVCVELAKGTLTRSEAKRALLEVALDPKQLEHVKEITEKISKQEKEDSKKRSHHTVKGLNPN